MGQPHPRGDDPGVHPTPTSQKTDIERTLGRPARTLARSSGEVATESRPIA